MTKGRNRDTTWFSMIDIEWPKRQNTYLQWLDPMNFDKLGKQKDVWKNVRVRRFKTDQHVSAYSKALTSPAPRRTTSGFSPDKSTILVVVSVPKPPSMKTSTRLASWFSIS